MKEIRKPKFMQAAAVKRGHGIFGEICIAIVLFIVGFYGWWNYSGSGYDV